MQFVQLRAGYRHNPVTPAINVQLVPGSMTALTGSNGSGKSTLLKTIAGVLKPVAGECRIALSPREIGWMPQRSTLEVRFPLTVFELVAMGCWPRCGWSGGINKMMKQEIVEALQAVNMLDYADAQPATLSGGQLQRALFARLLVQQSRLWLLDEPFNGIDRHTVELLMAILQQQQQQGTTLLVVLHDRPLVERFFSDELSLDELSDARCGHSSSPLQSLPS